MTQATASARFNFDTVFGDDGDIVRAPVRARPKTSFSLDEVEAIRQEAFNLGVHEANQNLDVALNEISQAIAHVLQQQDLHIAIIRTDAAALALSAARKVAEHALANYPMNEIEKLITTALHDYHAEPRLVIKVPTDLCGLIQARVAALAQAEGYMGRTHVAADPSLTGANCRIEWADGGVERNTDRIFSQMEAEIARWHAAELAQQTSDAVVAE